MTYPLTYQVRCKQSLHLFSLSNTLAPIPCPCCILDIIYKTLNILTKTEYLFYKSVSMIYKTENTCYKSSCSLLLSGTDTALFWTVGFILN